MSGRVRLNKKAESIPEKSDSIPKTSKTGKKRPYEVINWNSDIKIKDSYGATNGFAALCG